MTDMITNGFIVHDNEGIIHGYGATAGEAWDDMLNTMRHANVTVLPDSADTSKELGNWINEADMVVAPATAALLQHVEDHGGDCSWGRVGRIACTVDEEAA